MKISVRIAIVVVALVAAGFLAVLLRIDCNGALAQKRINSAISNGKKMFVPVCIFDNSGRSWLYSGRPAGRLGWSFNGTDSFNSPSLKEKYLLTVIKNVEKVDGGYVLIVGGFGNGKRSVYVSNEEKDKVILAYERLDDNYLTAEDSFSGVRWSDEVELNKIFLENEVKKNDVVIVEFDGGEGKNKAADEVVRLILRRKV